MVLAKTKVSEDTYLVGIGVSPGISFGEVSLIDNRPQIDDTPIAEEAIAAEFERFHQALEEARRQLQVVRAKVAKQDHLEEHLYILDTHLLILDDKMLIQGTEQEIRQRRSAEAALKQVLVQLHELFANIEDEYLRDRRSDLDAVGDRLLRILTGVSERVLSEIPPQSLIVAHDLSPAQTMQLDRDKILGFVTDKGGRTSHTAVLARSLNIPAVVGLDSATALVHERMPIIVDGSTGVVVLRPSAATFHEYVSRKQKYEFLEQDLVSFRELPAQTRDGVRVALRGNLELESEFELIRRHAVEGIGLYRSEFLFMDRLIPPDEEEQYASYRRVLEAHRGQPVTIRTLDVGGDKFVPNLSLTDEPNPAMGLRAIRFSLREETLFRTQLRAILRASVHGQLRLLLPMVCGVSEIRSCKRILEEERWELKKDGIASAAEMEIGVMIETPAAVLAAPFLAREVDFFSIGTNDLIQYCMAADRGNEHVAYLYKPLHPAILRAIKMTCDAAAEAGIEVGMCGEMAGEPLYTLALIGLGLNELSMSPASVPRVKRVLRQVALHEGRELVDELLTLSTSKDVAQALDRRMRQLLPEIFDQPII
jgi:phosphotransferase system enzyme I (PtsI)